MMLVPSTRAEKFNSEVSIMACGEELRSRWCHRRVAAPWLLRIYGVVLVSSRVKGQQWLFVSGSLVE